MTKSDVWDLVVVGGGTAGIVGARTAASLGARTLLVERDRMGGDCLWTGCVPSKTLLAAAHHVADARRAAAAGIHVATVRIDFAAVMSRVHQSVATIEPDDSAATLQTQGVVVQRGNVSFETGDRLLVDGVGVATRGVLLATGARPALPPIPGLAAASPVTSDTVWALTELPGRLVVLGGGSIGCELGQAMARLGAEVTILEGAPRILPREDADAASLVQAALEFDGVRVITADPVASVEANDHGTGGVVSLTSGDRVDYDVLLVAVGRTPRTRDLGLESVNVQIDERGFVVVDESLRTTNRRIWAAGDITGHPQFTHLAGVHGSLAASNAVLGLRRKVDATVPRVTFTDPEVAAVGAPTDGAAQVITTSHQHVDRAIAEGRTDGFARLALDDKGKVIGATIVGPRAGESLGEITLAIRLGLTTRDLAATTHPYPTYADGAWKAAIADTRARLARGITSTATGVLGEVQRRRVERRRPLG
jgi:pyruvate/2-oxoglutarate dehydrogenase complex dihydrolipoamide dehydrogenase (E3) component